MHVRNKMDVSMVLIRKYFAGVVVVVGWSVLIVVKLDLFTQMGKTTTTRGLFTLSGFVT